MDTAPKVSYLAYDLKWAVPKSAFSDDIYPSVFSVQSRLVANLSNFQVLSTLLISETLVVCAR